MASLRGCSRLLWNKYVYKCRVKNMYWGLSEEEFLALSQSNCHYCGKPPLQKVWRKRPTAFIYNGIDRMDNALGYSPENCVTCCGDCNKLKGDHLTHDETMAAVGAVLGVRRKQGNK